MLDNPARTARLMRDMQAALPFEADMTPELARTLTAGQGFKSKGLRQTVSAVHYAGDAGGIVCRIGSDDESKAVFASLTHLRIPRTLPFAAAAIAYQRRRVKMIKKEG